MAKVVDANLPPGTTGLILHTSALYDFAVWLMTLGRERSFREKVLALARLQPGESVLDVGCGTGALAIAAKRQAGRSGAVYGIDASPEMIARANKKARKAGLEIDFRQAAAQALPFPDGQLDVVLSTIMLHHLPRKARGQCASEVRRVLKPGGRVLVVEFAEPIRKPGHSLLHLHRHGHVNLSEIVATFSAAGVSIVDKGSVGFGNLQFALGLADGSVQPTPADANVQPTPTGAAKS